MITLESGKERNPNKSDYCFEVKKKQNVLRARLSDKNLVSVTTFTVSNTKMDS